jgi:hypothetical protein
MSQPSFLIIGSQKAGTTSLYKYLCQHPKILEAKKKEVNFFGDQFHQGIDFYQTQFPKLKPGEITGDATPEYCLFPKIPVRVHQLFPEMKIIFLLRNPVERAISHYHHNLVVDQILSKKRAEYKKREVLGFGNAIEKEYERLKLDVKKLNSDDNYHRSNYYNYIHHSYLTRGIYFYQVKNWIENFPKEQIIILKSEDFFRNTNEVFTRVLSFLNIENFELENYKEYNKRSVSKKTSFLLRYTLSEYFQPHNKKLESYLGMDFNWDIKESELYLDKDKLSKLQKQTLYSIKQQMEQLNSLCLENLL